MIDGFAFVQSNKATDHSMAYADLDSSNRELKSLSSAIAMWISMFGKVEYLGVSTCPIPTQASTLHSPACNIISRWYQYIFYPAWMSWCQKSTVALISWICGLSNLLPIISQHCFRMIAVCTTKKGEPWKIVLKTWIPLPSLKVRWVGHREYWSSLWKIGQAKKEIAKRYQRVVDDQTSGKSFWQRAVEQLDL